MSHSSFFTSPPPHTHTTLVYVHVVHIASCTHVTMMMLDTLHEAVASLSNKREEEEKEKKQNHFKDKCEDFCFWRMKKANIYNNT